MARDKGSDSSDGAHDIYSDVSKQALSIGQELRSLIAALDGRMVLLDGTESDELWRALAAKDAAERALGLTEYLAVITTNLAPVKR